MQPDEEVESALLKFLGSRNSGNCDFIRSKDAQVQCACKKRIFPTLTLLGMPFALAVQRFNCNVDYSGLVHAVTSDGWFKENKVVFLLHRNKLHACLICPGAFDSWRAAGFAGAWLAFALRSHMPRPRLP